MVRERIEWHDLRIAPYDLPDPNEPILTTTESVSEIRTVRTDIHFEYVDDDEYNFIWYRQALNPTTGEIEDTIFWEEVVAWAYYPKLYDRIRENL